MPKKKIYSLCSYKNRESCHSCNECIYKDVENGTYVCVNKRFASELAKKMYLASEHHRCSQFTPFPKYEVRVNL